MNFVNMNYKLKGECYQSTNCNGIWCSSRQQSDLWPE